jgi:hypothetical protein
LVWFNRENNMPFCRVVLYVLKNRRINYIKITPPKKLPLIFGLCYQLIIVVWYFIKILSSKIRHIAPLKLSMYSKTEESNSFLKQSLQKNLSLTSGLRYQLVILVWYIIKILSAKIRLVAPLKLSMPSKTEGANPHPLICHWFLGFLINLSS